MMGAIDDYCTMLERSNRSLRAYQKRLAEQIKAKDEAIDKALHELGIPGPGYLSPVANAIVALKQALKGGDDEKADS